MRRLDILKLLASNTKQDFTYSAIMRQLVKKSPEKIYTFISSFKEAFDAALLQELDHPESVALMQAVTTIGAV